MDTQPLALVTPYLVPSPPPQPAWSLGKRIAFRFVFVYSLLYSFPFPLGYLPLLAKLDDRYDSLLHRLIPWLGKHALHISRAISGVSTGSGDKTYNYVLFVFWLLLATLATIVWSILDRRRRRYDLGWTLLVLFTRYVLIAAMVNYGISKVLDLQFQPPQAGRLSETYGESSPMGLLWTFMGASVPYTMFAGFAELVGAALLAFRRTTLLGALVLIGVMGNVVVLNFCYDVPVKLYASHLWLMALFLTLPDRARLYDFFVRQRAVAPRPVATPFVGRRLSLARRIVKPLLIVGIVWQAGYSRWDRVKAKSMNGPQGAMNGAWHVVSATSDGKPLKWRRVVTNNRTLGVIDDGDSDYYKLVDDGAKKTLTLTSYDRPKEAASVVTYARSGEHGTLDGQLGGKAIHVELEHIDTSKSLLMTRGFHWINETPFNR